MTARLALIAAPASRAACVPFLGVPDASGATDSSALAVVQGAFDWKSLERSLP